MNTQAVTAKAIDWGKVSRFVLRFAWAAAVLIFKLALMAFSFLVSLLTSGRQNDGHQRDEDERSQRDIDDYQFMIDSEYRKRRR